jgi:hypothetical protein
MLLHINYFDCYFFHYLLIIHEVLDWESVRKYFIELMIIFLAGSVMFQAGILARVALALSI